MKKKKRNRYTKYNVHIYVYVILVHVSDLKHVFVFFFKEVCKFLKLMVTEGLISSRTSPISLKIVYVNMTTAVDVPFTCMCIVCVL